MVPLATCVAAACPACLSVASASACDMCMQSSVLGAGECYDIALQCVLGASCSAPQSFHNSQVGL